MKKWTEGLDLVKKSRFKNNLNKNRLNPEINYSTKLSPSKHHYYPLNIGVYVENIQYMDGGITDNAKNINKRLSTTRNHDVPMVYGIIITNCLYLPRTRSTREKLRAK